MQADCDDAQESQGFSTWDTNAEDENNMDPEQRKQKAQKLSEALAVLAIRPPSFNSLFTKGRLEQLKNLLEKAVKERCDTWSDRQELLELGLPVPPPKTSKASSKVGQEEYTPFIDEAADLPTIHEAYQYLNKVYINDIIELKKKRKAAGMKMDALVGFGGGSLSRRASFARQKSTDQTSNKDKKSKENESDSEEDEGKKLLNQIDGLIGNLGIEDPMTGNNKRNMSRRGSRVPAGDGSLNIDAGGASRSRRGSFAPGDSLGMGIGADNSTSRRGSRVAGMENGGSSRRGSYVPGIEDDAKDKKRKSRVPGNSIVDVTMANNAKNELSIGDKKNKKNRKSMRKKKDKERRNKKDKEDENDD